MAPAWSLERVPTVSEREALWLSLVCENRIHRGTFHQLEAAACATPHSHHSLGLIEGGQTSDGVVVPIRDQQ